MDDQENVELLSVVNRPHPSNSSNLPREILKGLLGNWSVILLFLILMGVSGGLLYGVIQLRNDMADQMISLSKELHQNMTQTQQEFQKAIQDINATLVDAFQQIDIIEKNISQLIAKQLIEEIRNTERRINTSATDLKHLILDTTEKLDELQHKSEADLIQLKNLSTQVNQTIQNFYQRVDPITTDLNNLKGNMSEVQENVDSLQNNTALLVQEIATINSSITLVNKTTRDYINNAVNTTSNQLPQEIDHVNASVALLNKSRIKQSVSLSPNGNIVITPLKTGTTLPFARVNFNQSRAPIATIFLTNNSQTILLKGGHQYLIEVAPLFEWICGPGNCQLLYHLINLNTNEQLGNYANIFPGAKPLMFNPQHTIHAFIQNEQDTEVQLRISYLLDIVALNLNAASSYLNIITLS